MAAKVRVQEKLPDFPGSLGTKRLEGSLVAKRTKQSVPDHLSDTKIFTQAKRNGILQCKPAVIHFDGYKVGQVHQQTLHIINASRENQQMHIIPPTTSYFGITYQKKRSSLVPGLSLDLTVHFKPTKWQYYYDCVRIHCKGDQNILIPIHGYPVMNTTQFPRNVTFPVTPLGTTRTKTISLKCDVPIDFEFELAYLEHHPAFSVTPMKGIVSASSDTLITVTYSPTEYNTAFMKLQLELSQFNSSPIVCAFAGSSVPGLALEKVKKLDTVPVPKRRPHRVPSLTGKPHKPAKIRPLSNTTIPSKPSQTELLYEGIHIPLNTDTPYAMSKVLSQKPGKFKANTLKEALSSEVQLGEVPSRQIKEAAFLKKVRDTANQERANQLRWVTQKGSSLMREEDRELVLNARETERKVYQGSYVAIPDQEFSRGLTVTEYRRTRRAAHQVPSCEPKFDHYSNDHWSRRHSALNRFIQAARKVVVRLRCQQRLKRLKRLVSDIQAGRTIQESLSNLNKDPCIISIVPQLPSSLELVSQSVLPRYVSSEPISSQASSKGQALISTDRTVHKKVPLLDLKVPQQYQLMGYIPQSVPAYGSYVPNTLSKPLRTGAEDEYASLGHIPGVEPSLLCAGEQIPVQDLEADTTVELVQLVPPQSLFRREPLHPIQLLNPCPGVVSFVPMLDNSVVTLEHVLKPLPAFPTSKHPPVRLHPTDAIPELMHWRKYPNHYLTATEAHSKLVSHWKPQWTDQTSPNLVDTLEGGEWLMTGPHPDDFVDHDSDTLQPVPTMEMIQGQFQLEGLPLTTDHWAEALTKLETQKTEHLNQLGQKIQQKFKTLLDSSRQTILDH